MALYHVRLALTVTDYAGRYAGTTDNLILMLMQHPDTIFRRHSIPDSTPKPTPHWIPRPRTVPCASGPTFQRTPFFDPADPVLTPQQQGVLLRWQQATHYDDGRALQVCPFAFWAAVPALYHTPVQLQLPPGCEKQLACLQGHEP